jgi:hypothetical protein
MIGRREALADFDDIRHLTPHGGREFVENIEGIVLDQLASVASGEDP